MIVDKMENQEIMLIN